MHNLWILVILIVAMIVFSWVMLLRARKAGGKMSSLVLMLKEPREIDAQAVRRAVTKAFGVRVGSTTEEENFVVQLSPETMPVRINGLPLGFICAPKPYVDRMPSDEELKDMDERLARVLREHKGWISCDLIADIPRARKAEVYPHIARILAEFLDDNVLGIFCPENDRLMYNHPGLKEELLGEDPLAALEMKDAPQPPASLGADVE